MKDIYLLYHGTYNFQCEIYKTSTIDEDNILISSVWKKIMVVVHEALAERSINLVT